MEKLEFKNKIFEELKNKSHMVLGTSANNRVTTRNVSTIFINGKIYFQTDVELLKYIQIMQNSNVSLCELDMQVEGTAKVLGHPLEKQNQEFFNTFSKKHKGSFERYTYLPNEVVIEVTPKFIEMWAYENGRPYVYNLNLETDDFLKKDYPINHNMKLNESSFERMKDGANIIEYRLNDEKRQLVKVGDTIHFTKLPNLDESLLTEVEDIQHFKTFYDAFKELRYSDNTDTGDDIEKSVITMRKFYSEEDEKKYGTLAIKIRVLKRIKN